MSNLKRQSKPRKSKLYDMARDKIACEHWLKDLPIGSSVEKCRPSRSVADVFLTLLLLCFVKLIIQRVRSRSGGEESLRTASLGPTLRALHFRTARTATFIKPFRCRGDAPVDH